MIVTQTHTETQLQSKGFKNRVDIYDGHFNPRMARFHGVEQVDEERVQLTKLEDMNNGILRYLSEEVPTGNADRVCSCAEILQITNHLEEMRRILQKEFQHNADRLYSQGKPTLKERLQHSVHELTDAISVYHQMAKEVPKTISATPSPITPDLNLSNSMINVNTADNAGFLLSPSFSNTPPIVPPVLLVEHTEKINFCPRCGTSLSQSPPSTVPAVICGSSPAFSKMGDMNWKHPDYSSACTIIICPSCAWKASNKTDEPEKDRNAFLLTASAPLYDWNTGDTSNYWCI